MKHKTMFIAAAALLLLGFAAATLVYRKNKAQASRIAEYNRAPLVRPHSPTLGKADAPVVIVEFFDPACETCSAFYPLVKGMMASNPDDIRLVLRYAPFHNGSDKVVALLEAARKQGKYWQALEALLASQAEWAPHHTPQVALAWRQLEGLELDRARMRADMASPEIASLIAQDLADAAALNVTQTPEYFVNGNPLPTFGFGPLKQLVADALLENRR